MACSPSFVGQLCRNSGGGCRGRKGRSNSVLRFFPETTVEERQGLRRGTSIHRHASYSWPASTLSLHAQVKHAITRARGQSRCVGRPLTFARRTDELYRKIHREHPSPFFPSFLLQFNFRRSLHIFWGATGPRRQVRLYWPCFSWDRPMPIHRPCGRPALDHLACAALSLT